MASLESHSTEGVTLGGSFLCIQWPSCALWTLFQALPSPQWRLKSVLFHLPLLGAQENGVFLVHVRRQQLFLLGWKMTSSFSLNIFQL